MAKRSRRARRAETSKPRKSSDRSSIAAQEVTVEEQEVSPDLETTAETSRSEPSTGRKAVNFGQEYFYLYQELRTILIVATAMFAVLVALSFVI